LKHRDSPALVGASPASAVGDHF